MTGVGMMLQRIYTQVWLDTDKDELMMTDKHDEVPADKLIGAVGRHLKLHVTEYTHDLSVAIRRSWKSLYHSLITSY